MKQTYEGVIYAIYRRLFTSSPDGIKSYIRFLPLPERTGEVPLSHFTQSLLCECANFEIIQESLDDYLHVLRRKSLS